MTTFSFTQRVLCVAVLAVASVSSHAEDFTFGAIPVTPTESYLKTIDIFKTVSTVGVAESFSDKFSFSLSSFVDANGTVFSNNNAFRNVSFTSVQLFNLADLANPVLIGGGGVSEVKGGGLFAPGSYYFLIDGVATGGFAGASQPRYSVNISADFIAAAVPEPESYAMLLAGLGVMGAIARRRKQAKFN